MTLQNSQVTAEAVQGQGGNIRIIAGTFLADPSSVVSASSQFGVSGNVQVQSPLSSLSNTLAVLPTRPLQGQPLLQQRCAAQANGQLSSLVVAGRDALPTEPGGWLMSPLALGNNDTVSGAYPHAKGPVPSSGRNEPLDDERFYQWRAAVRGGQLGPVAECGS